MTFPTSKVPWNKGKLVGQKLPLKLEQIWAIRIRLEVAKNIRELAMFNIAIDTGTEVAKPTRGERKCW